MLIGAVWVSDIMIVLKEYIIVRELDVWIAQHMEEQKTNLISGQMIINKYKMKINTLIFLFVLSAGMLYAQDKVQLPPADVIQNYLSETKEYAALFSGKIVTPYDRPFSNHPYLATFQYVQGTLCYNEVVYTDILMRLDLFRDEFAVVFAEKPHHIVLEKEKFTYAVLRGFTVITSTIDSKTGSKYVLLIHDGLYPIVKQYRGSVREELSNTTVNRYIRFREQYFIFVNEIAYPIKNKNTLLKLFPDKRKELNEYAKQHKLNFRSQFEQSVVALVNHYETLNK